MTQHTVIVVHGVGDPQPSDALSDLVKGLCITQSWRQVGDITARHKDARGATAELIETFPVNEAFVDVNTASGAKRVKFVEVYWGDLSRVKGTLAGLLLGFVDLIFGIRHVTKAARQELLAAPGRKAIAPFRWLVGWTASAALWFGRGPVVSLNILASILVALYFASSLTDGAEVWREGGRVGVLISIVSCTLAGWLLQRLAHRNDWSTTTAEGMIGVGVLAIGVYLLCYMFWPQSLTYEHSIEALTTALSVAASLMSVCVIILIVASLPVFVFARSQSVRRAITVITVCTILSSALLVLALMIYWAVLADRLKGAVAERIETALHLFGLVWLTFLLVAVIYLVLMAVTSFRARKHHANTRYPRYIVNRWVVVLLLATGLLWPLLFLPLITSLECAAVSHFEVCRWLANSGGFQRLITYIRGVEAWNQIAIVLSIFAASALVLVQARVGTALDLVIDVIAHFRLPERVLFHRFDPLKSASPPMRQPTWNLMVDRFRSILDEELAVSGLSAVTVLAHSQGTMIALEALHVIGIDRKGFSQSSPLRVNKHAATSIPIDLVTMGSPLSHLYTHYLPGRYSINPKRSSGIKRWINIYRADDFVGREIDNPADAAFPLNHKVGPRGHTHYWSDREVLEHLVAYIR